MNLESEFSRLGTLLTSDQGDLMAFDTRLLLLKARNNELSPQEAKRIEAFCARYNIDLAPVSIPQTASINLRVTGYVMERLPGVSLVTACMNRNENLLRALRSWIELAEISEILIVDWSSTNPVYDDIARMGLLDPRVKVVRIEKQPRWILTYAFNVGFRLANFDRVVKADADIVLSADFFKKNLVTEGAFIAGDWRTGQEHTNGFFYLHHSDLMLANGFNEFIKTYGWDDDDLYERLVNMGVSRTRVSPETIHHLDHPDSKRLAVREGEPANALEELEQDRLFNIRANRVIVRCMPMWGRRSGMLPVNVREISDNYMVAEQMRDSFHIVPDHVIEDARYYAALEIASLSVTRKVYNLEKAKLWAYLSQKRLEHVHRLDVSILLYTDRRLESIRPTWMLSCSESVYQKYAKCQDFLNRLETFAAGENFNIVLHVPDAYFQDCSASLETRGGLYCVPSSEECGLLSYVPAERAYQDLRAGVLPRAATSLTLQSGNIDGLLRLIGAKRVDTPPHILCRNKIYVDVQHGLGNRLRSLASAAVVADKIDRELVVVWQPDHHCEAGMTDLFDYKGALIEASFVSELGPETDFYNYMEAEPNSEKDALITFNTGRDLYVRTSCILNSKWHNWKDESIYLQGLMPQRAVLDLVQPFDLKGHTAVHVRMEGAGGGKDGVRSYEEMENWSVVSHERIQFWREKSHYSHFIKRLDRLIHEEPETRLFLAADTTETYEVFTEAFAERICYLKRPLFDRSKDQIIYALADILLLSRCERFLGSNWSSFSEVAMRFASGFKSVEMSGTDF